MKALRKNIFWVVLLAALVAVVALLASTTETTTTTDTSPEDSASSALLLSEAATEQAVLIEYSDFQCPGCANMAVLLQDAKAEFGDSISFEFRHFPLTSIHPNAMTAHRIAQAADNQGQFLAVHDLLFTTTASWSNASNPAETIYSLIEAGIPNIDTAQLRNDADASASLQAINQDIASGMDAGVRGTPTLFLDGQELRIGSYGDLQNALQAVLDKETTDE